MRIEIEGTEPESVLRVYLVQAEDEVRLRARSCHGMDWTLLTLSDGGIRRCKDVADYVGLPVDDEGRIMLTDE